MGRSRYKIFENSYPHFLTCTIVNWLPLFSNPHHVQIVFDSLRFLQQHNRIELYAYIVMENHLHLIASSEDLAGEVAKFKSFTARSIIDHLLEIKAVTILKNLAFYKAPHKTDRDYQFWQEGSHPQMIQNEPMMRQKIEYIHNNPIRRGYVDQAEHWRYSSARNYAGQEGILEITIPW